MFLENVLSPVLKSLSEFPDKVSFCINEKFFTYDDLAKSISKIRARLQEQKPITRNIGLLTNDDIETYASIYAIWLEGYSYVPIHPKHPAKRNMEILEQANISLIIDSSESPVFKSLDCIESRSLVFNRYNLIPNSVPDDYLAYILFTSGSTGKPKGVPITRENLGAFMKAFWEVGFNLDNSDRCLQCFDLTFDVSVQSFTAPLSRGASIYTIPHDQIKYSYAYELLEEHKLTFCAMAPSMVRFLQPYFDEIELPDLKYSILTAEASSLDLVEAWAKCIPNADIFNFYGPTEATIYCSFYKIHPHGENKQHNGMVSIGKPFNDLLLIVVDENDRILEHNQKGELCVSGGQVTPGYWQNPEKNETSFFTLEWERDFHRFYKTGDLCYIDKYGDIMYIGRKDYQVKIQGFRIELGEIEHYTREILQDRNVVAIPYENIAESHEIALFIEGSTIDKDSVLVFLKDKLPYYMVPSKIITINIFPLNSNGKVDRNALRNSIKL